MTESKEVNRQKLEELAKELGIKVDSEWQYWSNYNLLAKIAELRRMKKDAPDSDDDDSIMGRFSHFKKSRSS
jgi:hypothetical protein